MKNEAVSEAYKKFWVDSIGFLEKVQWPVIARVHSCEVGFPPNSRLRRASEKDICQAVKFLSDSMFELVEFKNREINFESTKKIIFELHRNNCKAARLLKNYGASATWNFSHFIHLDSQFRAENGYPEHQSELESISNEVKLEFKNQALQNQGFLAFFKNFSRSGMLKNIGCY